MLVARRNSDYFQQFRLSPLREHTILSEYSIVDASNMERNRIRSLFCLLLTLSTFVAPGSCEETKMDLRFLLVNGGS
eukprot:scaffold11080_cov115-Amphora_coffeaeformis.AAC.1